MRRRDILFSAAATAVVGWSAGAQEGPKSARIGFIVTGELWPRRHFDEAMQRLGWAEGRNLTVERRVTGEDPERRKIAAAELVATNPDVIVAAGTLDAQTLLALTRTIPIVVVRGQDLVEMGLVNSLARPGGNVTRIVVRGEELDGRRLQLLRELIPAAARISVLGYTQGPRSVPRAAAIEALARPLGLQVTARLVSEAEELGGAFAASAADHDQAMFVQGSSLIFRISTACSRSRHNTDCRRSTNCGNSLIAGGCCPTER